MKVLSIIGCLIVLLHSGVSSQQTDSVQQLVGSYLKAVGSFGNAGQVILAKGNQPIVNTCYGWARIEEKVSVTPETIFELASTSKMFTALAILKLEMQSKLNVRDSLGRFFPQAPEDKRGITIHQLLTHTSGLPGGDMVEDFEEISKRELVEKILAIPLRAKPATRFIYSNAGYNLLAAIIEKQSGKEYGAYLKESIFDPAGMTHSFINGAAELSTLATAHAYQGVKNNGGPERPVFNVRTWGGGSVCANASDLWKLKLALDSNQLIDENAKEKMFSVQVKIAEDNNYGYGCFVYWNSGRKVIDFIGETERGFNCTFRNFIDDQLTLISISNASQPNERHNRWFLDAHLKNLWLESRHFRLPPVTTVQPSDVLARSCGRFQWHQSGINVTSRGDNLLLEAEGQQAVDFLYMLDDSQKLRVAEVTRKVDSLMTGFVHQNREGFSSIMNENAMSELETERDELIRQHGKIIGFRLKGVIPDRDPNFMIASIELQCEKKTLPFFTMWNLEDTTRAMLDFCAAGLETPFQKIFASLGPRQWISYDFFNDRISKEIIFEQHNQVLTDRQHKSLFGKIGK